MEVDGKIYDCFLCSGKNSGMNFWTYSLRERAILNSILVRQRRKGRRRIEGKELFFFNDFPYSIVFLTVSEKNWMYI